MEDGWRRDGGGLEEGWRRDGGGLEGGWRRVGGGMEEGCLTETEEEDVPLQRIAIIQLLHIRVPCKVIVLLADVMRVRCACVKND